MRTAGEVVEAGRGVLGGSGYPEYEIRVADTVTTVWTRDHSEEETSRAFEVIWWPTSDSDVPIGERAITKIFESAEQRETFLAEKVRHQVPLSAAAQTFERSHPLAEIVGEILIGVTFVSVYGQLDFQPTGTTPMPPHRRPMNLEVPPHLLGVHSKLAHLRRDRLRRWSGGAYRPGRDGNGRPHSRQARRCQRPAHRHVRADPLRQRHNPSGACAGVDRHGSRHRPAAGQRQGAEPREAAAATRARTREGRRAGGNGAATIMSRDQSRAHKERELRAAAERLLTGRAIHTDGTCDATTLATEAGVSRQDLYGRHRPLLEEFRSHLRRVEESGAPSDRRGAELKRLGEKLSQADARAARYRLERDDARSERDANASRVAYLDEQNTLLRRQSEAVRSVSPLRRKND